MRLDQHSFGNVATIVTRYGYDGPKATTFRRISKDDYDAIRYDTIYRVRSFEPEFKDLPKLEDPFIPPVSVKMTEFFTLVHLYLNHRIWGFTVPGDKDISQFLCDRLEQEYLLDYVPMPEDMTLGSLRQLGHARKVKPMYLIKMSDAAVHRTISLWQLLFPEGIDYAESLFFDRAAFPEW